MTFRGQCQDESRDEMPAGMEVCSLSPFRLEWLQIAEKSGLAATH
jgi:hypothetical protein